MSQTSHSGNRSEVGTQISQRVFGFVNADIDLTGVIMNRLEINAIIGLYEDCADYYNTGSCSPPI